MPVPYPAIGSFVTGGDVANAAPGSKIRLKNSTNKYAWTLRDDRNYLSWDGRYIARPEDFGDYRSYVWDTFIPRTGGESEELTSFKLAVREVAERAAKRYGWCDEVQAILAELGIPKREKTYKVGDTITKDDLSNLPLGTVFKVNSDRALEDDNRLRVIIADRKYLRCFDGATFPLMTVREATIQFIPQEDS